MNMTEYFTIAFNTGVAGLVTFGIYKILSFITNDCYIFKECSMMFSHSLVSNFHGCVREIINLMNRNPKAYRVVGMDCEMTSDSTNGGHPVPAILQLANPNGYCTIFQLSVMDKSQSRIEHLILPSSITMLTQVLEDPAILKVGVAVLNDAMYLEEKYGLVTKGCLDIRHVAEKVKVKPTGLDGLGTTVLGRGKMELRKKRPWESKVLSPKQLEYAVEDARLGIDLFMELNKRYINQRYSLLRRLFWDEKTFWRHTVKQWENFVGKPFTIKKEELELTSIECNSWKEYLPVQKYLGLISNIIILQSAVYCHVCSRGCEETFRKAVIPADYNMYSDGAEFKVLCKMCFQRSRQVGYRLREELTELCGAPRPDYEDSRLMQAKKLVKNILENTNKKPSDSYELNQYRLCELLGLSRRQLSYETLQIVSSMDCWPGSSHGQFVHDYFENVHPDGLERLRYMWRDRFSSLESWSWT